MATAQRLLSCRFSEGDMESHLLLNGFDHALPDAYICSASRPASPAASLSLQYIFSFVYLAISIPRDCLLDELDLLAVWECVADLATPAGVAEALSGSVWWARGVEGTTRGFSAVNQRLSGSRSGRRRPGRFYRFLTSPIFQR